MKPLRIVYMGTPDFAVPALRRLAEAGHEIGLVLTQPDRQRDRGKKQKASPVKEAAGELSLNVIQPESLKSDPEAAAAIGAFAPDAIAVAAYGQILPPSILEIPALGCFNIHASLLPRYRGAAPVQRAIMEGEKRTGVCIMKMEEGLDTGPVLARAETEIGEKTFGELFAELAEMGAALLPEVLEAAACGGLFPEPQDHRKATYAPMLRKSDGALDFSSDPAVLERQIRALDPRPGAFTGYRGQLLKVWKARAAGETASAPPGTVLRADSGGIDVSAGGKVLRLLEIQLPGKKRMAVKEFIKGREILLPLVLGNPPGQENPSSGGPG